MPRSTQIIPKYTFPHEETYINDNSAVALTEQTNTSTVLNYIGVFVSSRGVDGKLVYIDKLKDYRTVFGKTDSRKYGQAQLMPEALLRSPNVGVWCMRLMPDDATYANSILSLWFKEDEENGAFRIKFTTKSITNDSLAGLTGADGLTLSDRDDIIEMGLIPDGTPVDGVYVDDEGYTQVPIAVFTAMGKGIYGQNLRWRITPDHEYEREYGLKLFDFEILDVTDGVEVLYHKPVGITVNPNINPSKFVNDVVDDESDGGKIPAHIHVFDENIEELYAKYVAFYNKMLENDPTLSVSACPSLYNFDPFFGTECKVKHSVAAPSLPFIKFAVPKTADIDDTADGYVADDYTSTEIISVDNVAGNIFMGGTDGAFASADASARAEAIDEMYIRAFSGEVDRLILSQRRVPSVSMFDANYSMPVKLALVRLALHRLSSILYLDTGHRDSLGTTDIRTITTDFQPILDILEDFDTLEDTWPVSINAQEYTITEECTGRRVTVTHTYYLALTDPEYRRTNAQTPVPRTGQYATLTGHTINSLKPAIDESDGDLKQALKDARINYFEAVGVNQFERSTDHTFVSDNSDLGIEGNVIALLGLKRIMETEFRMNRNLTTTPEKRADFKNYLVDKYDYLKGTTFDTFDIQYRSNEYEAARDITHAYIAVRYFPRGEITLIEIDIEPKLYKEDAEDE